MKTSSSILRSPSQTQRLILMKRIVMNFTRHWLLIVNILIGAWVLLPWLAPVFMQLGWSSIGKAIYLFYSFQCHQMPQRSFFLFGDQAMYSLAEIQAAGVNAANPFLLRQFIGNSEMGWKVAWSDRMVSMYTSILFGGLLYGLVRKQLKPLSVWTFALFLVPMAIDGGTHMLSDFAGIGQGFRDTNAWLQAITNNAFPLTFYQGDVLGSFNSWARLVTGALFGIALVWLAYPPVNDSFADMAHHSEATLMKGVEA